MTALGQAAVIDQVLVAVIGQRHYREDPVAIARAWEVVTAPGLAVATALVLVTDQELVIVPALATALADPDSAAEIVPSSAVATRSSAEATTSTLAIAPAGAAAGAVAGDMTGLAGATVVDTAIGATTGTTTTSTIITTAGTTDAGVVTGEVVGMFRWSTEQPPGE